MTRRTDGPEVSDFPNAGGLQSSISVRAARTEDEPPVQEMTRNTFPWGDYVGEVFGVWATESQDQGQLYVAEISGKLVGVTHVRYLSEDEAWFEGIRVHPDFRRLGVGRSLTQASIDGARQRGIKVCRAAIDRDNVKSAGLAKSFGFTVVSVNVENILQISAETESPNFPVQRAKLTDVGPSFILARKSLHLICCDFVWRSVTEHNIRSLVSEGVLLVARLPRRDSVNLGEGVSPIIAGACSGGSWVEVRNKGSCASKELNYEVSSPFGDIDGIRSIICHVMSEAKSEARKRGLTAARLTVNVEEGDPVLACLPAWGFAQVPSEPGEDIWELKL